MSAWIVSKEHIDLLVTAGIKIGRGRMWTAPTLETGTALGRMLWAENVSSVAYRYGDNDGDDQLPGYDARPNDYAFTQYPGIPDPVTVLKSIACYEYQSCEHPAWKESDSAKYCRDLQSACIAALPGWDAAPWGIDDLNAFTKLRSAS